jgi:hypothetical protein
MQFEAESRLPFTYSTHALAGFKADKDRKELPLFSLTRQRSCTYRLESAPQHKALISTWSSQFSDRHKALPGIVSAPNVTTYLSQEQHILNVRSSLPDVILNAYFLIIYRHYYTCRKISPSFVDRHEYTRWRPASRGTVRKGKQQRIRHLAPSPPAFSIIPFPLTVT